MTTSELGGATTGVGRSCEHRSSSFADARPLVSRSASGFLQRMSALLGKLLRRPRAALLHERLLTDVPTAIMDAYPFGRMRVYGIQIFARGR